MHAARVQPQRQLPPRGELRAGARRLRRRAQRGRGRRQRAVAREEREARVRARPRRRCAAQAPRACAHTTLLRTFWLVGPYRLHLWGCRLHIEECLHAGLGQK